MNSPSEPTWLRLEPLLAAHELQLSEHGGTAGLRDLGLLESALARPQQLAAYVDPPPDVPTLGAAYAIAVVRNHPFVDGNKRVGLIALELFLNLNNYEFAAPDTECVITILDRAAGEITDERFRVWVQRWARPQAYL